jgi:hypothetical protein
MSDTEMSAFPGHAGRAGMSAFPGHAGMSAFPGHAGRAGMSVRHADPLGVSRD